MTLFLGYIGWMLYRLNLFFFIFCIFHKLSTLSRKDGYKKKVKCSWRGKFFGNTRWWKTHFISHWGHDTHSLTLVLLSVTQLPTSTPHGGQWPIWIVGNGAKSAFYWGKKISILLRKNKFSKPFPPMERTLLYFIQQMFLSTYEIVRAWSSCSATSDSLPRHFWDFHKSAGQSLLLEW